jgi:hypothetical protein
MFLFETNARNWIEPFNAIPDFAEINQEGERIGFSEETQARENVDRSLHTPECYCGVILSGLG